MKFNSNLKLLFKFGRYSFNDQPITEKYNTLGTSRSNLFQKINPCVIYTTYERKYRHSTMLIIKFMNLTNFLDFQKKSNTE